MPKIQPLFDATADNNSKAEAVRKEAADGKLSDEQQNQIKEYDEQTAHNREEEKKLASEYASAQPLVKQVIDLALLANNLLRGQQLNEFIRRSVTLL